MAYNEKQYYRICAYNHNITNGVIYNFNNYNNKKRNDIVKNVYKMFIGLFNKFFGIKLDNDTGKFIFDNLNDKLKEIFYDMIHRNSLVFEFEKYHSDHFKINKDNHDDVIIENHNDNNDVNKCDNISNIGDESLSDINIDEKENGTISDSVIDDILNINNTSSEIKIYNKPNLPICPFGIFMMEQCDKIKNHKSYKGFNTFIKTAKILWKENKQYTDFYNSVTNILNIEYRDFNKQFKSRGFYIYRNSHILPKKYMDLLNNDNIINNNLMVNKEIKDVENQNILLEIEKYIKENLYEGEESILDFNNSGNEIITIKSDLDILETMNNGMQSENIHEIKDNIIDNSENDNDIKYEPNIIIDKESDLDLYD